MGERLGVVWDERLAEYDFGPGHPLAPIRVRLAMRLAADLGLLARTTALGGGQAPADDRVAGCAADVADGLGVPAEGTYLFSDCRADDVGGRNHVVVGHHRSFRPGSAGGNSLSRCCD